MINAIASGHDCLHQTDIGFSESDFNQIAMIARTKYGLALQPSKKALVYSRLAKRIRHLKLDDFTSYCALLHGPNGHDEQPHFLSALTTNVTHFFREAHHFKLLHDDLMPELIRKAQSGQSVRLWSSACSSGQEAYCIAAMVIAACPDAASLDIKVLATDVDPKMIALAKLGRYEISQLSTVPPQFQSTFTGPNLQSGGTVHMHSKLREIISFAELNLVGDWPMRRRFDVIFCRNVAIYFDPRTQHRLWLRFHDLLTPGGHLMIGHSERIGGEAKAKLHNVGITAYQKLPISAPSIDFEKE